MSQDALNFKTERTSTRRLFALVVEDNTSLRKFERKLLELRGFVVLEAVDGLEGVEIFRQEHEHIHLVVMDLDMPRMSGIDAFSAMRSIRADVRIIIVSGHAPEDYSDRIPTEELAGALQKPFMPDEFFSILSRFD